MHTAITFVMNNEPAFGSNCLILSVNDSSSTRTAATKAATEKCGQGE